MVMVDYALHDQGLNALHDLYICKRKIEWHGIGALNLFIEGLEMRTLPTLDEWITRRIDAAHRLIADGLFDGTHGIRLRHQLSVPFRVWIGRWNPHNERGEPLTESNFYRSVGSDLRRALKPIV